MENSKQLALLLYQKPTINLQNPRIQHYNIIRTKLIQSIYNSLLYSYLGRDVYPRTEFLLAITISIGLAIPCDYYRRNKVQREYEYILLYPLSVPDRGISIDFIIDLPNSEGNESLQVIKDRFSIIVYSYNVPLPIVTSILGESGNVYREDYYNILR